MTTGRREGRSAPTASEKEAVESAGLRYFNIPVTDGLPTGFQIIEFAHLVEEPENAPLLIHCGSGNRVGAMWALYRALKGITEEIALEETRTIGLRPELEAAVRKWLAEHVPTK